MIVENTITNLENFSWEELAEGKYQIDLRGFGNSKLEVQNLLSDGKFEDWNIYALLHLIRFLKIEGDFVFNQKTRNVKLFCYLHTICI